MPHKVALLCDPGIDGAFAVALALHDPDLEVRALLATAGNVSAERATNNIHILVDHLDPPRLPRLGAAPNVEYSTNGTQLHGASGLGGTDFPCAVAPSAIEREAAGGHRAPASPRGDAGVPGPAHGGVAHIRSASRCADVAAPDRLRRRHLSRTGQRRPGQRVPFFLRSGCCPPGASVRHPVTLIPLDLMRKVLFSPTDLLNVPSDGSPACRFLRQIVPYGIAATSNLYGIEGFHLKDVLGVVAVAQPALLKTRHMHVDVETRGELTRGMTVFDQRHWVAGKPNVDVAFEVDPAEVHNYMTRILGF